MVDEGALRNKCEVVEWSDIDQPKSVTILEKVKSGEITKEELDYLVVVAPKFIEFAGKGLETLKSISADISKAQEKAFDVSIEGIKALKDIALSSSSDEVKLKIAEYIHGALKDGRSMMSSLLDFGKVLVGGVALLAVGAVSVLAIKDRTSA